VAKFPREQVFNALYELLQTADYPFEVVNADGRVMQQWETFGSVNQPALYLQQGMQKAEQNTPGGSLGLNRWTYNAKAWLFFRRATVTDTDSPPNTLIPATVYNEIVDAIDAVVTPVIGQKQTLAAQNNGVPLVTNVRITEAAWDEGTLDAIAGQCVVMVGLEILTS
jgi:hypothetical protein